MTLLEQCIKAAEKNEPAVVTDIIKTQHLVVIPINDEGDFAILPVIMKDYIQNEELIIKV